MEQNCKLKDTNIGRTRRPTSNVDLNEDKIRLIKLEKLIFRDLKARLHKGEPTVINYLSKLFPSCQYPDSLQNYCVYCHKSYFLEDAKEEACTVPHDIDDYADEDGGDGIWCFEGECSYCGCHVEADVEIGERLEWGNCIESKRHCSQIEKRLELKWSCDDGEELTDLSLEDEDFEDCLRGSFNGCKKCQEKMRQHRIRAKATAKENKNLQGQSTETVRASKKLKTTK